MWKTMRGMCGSGRDACAMPNTTGQDESLLAALKRRYALGEITREQFEELKRTLGPSGASAANEHVHDQGKEH